MLKAVLALAAVAGCGRFGFGSNEHAVADGASDDGIGDIDGDGSDTGSDGGGGSDSGSDAMPGPNL
ncbi:MAG TPA: hypothetical protein VFV99_08755, partial [Kofleriaceae bacterium]|nr:hypothetical protein [Kofleriaceae bacterium]